MPKNAYKDSGLFLALCLMLLILLAAWKIVSLTGADIRITIIAVVYSVFTLIGALTVQWFTQINIGPAASGYFALVWPQWWDVVASAASKIKSPNDFYSDMQSNPWWNSEAFLWGVEALLISIFIYFLHRHLTNPYA